MKFFPAVAAGGIPMIEALSAPYSGIRFLPTGGINEDNVHNFLACEKVFACGGSWMVDKKLIDCSNFEEITQKTKQVMKSIK